MPKRKCSSVDTALGGNLVYYRKLAGLTQQQIADALTLNRSTYTKYETGASEPSIEILKRIAALLSVDVGSLLAEHKEDGSAVSDASLEIEQLSAEERNLLKKYNTLDREDREELTRLLNELTE